MSEPMTGPYGRAVVQGDLVGGRYRLIAVVGAGGMGRVWLGRDELLQRRVAVKEIATSGGDLSAMIPDVRSHTVREARAAAGLDHPGIVKVFDVLCQPERSWIVMEYVKSRSLHEAVQADGPLSHHEAARIGLAVLLALRAAHAGGVLHRDVKPHNVLLGDDGRVVLSDFGVATTGDTDTAGGPVLGSPSYVAPERLRGGSCGAASDLWSLGATLYAATEGVAPFARADPSATLAALVSDDGRDPPRRAGALTTVIDGLLVKDPQRRWTGADVERRLRRIIDDRPAAAAGGRVPAQRPGPQGKARGVARVVSSVPRRQTRRRWFTLVALAAAVAVPAVVASASPRAGVPPATAAATGAATRTVATAPAAAADAGALCGFAASPGPVVAATTRVPSDLPAGWVWYRDPAAWYAMAVPQGWLRSADGTVACFSDPAGRQAFAVDVTAPLTREPLAYWQGRERAALHDGTLPGYQRLGMGVLLVGRGGAEWEYTWKPDSDTRLHVRRILVTASQGRPYRLTWTTGEADWPAGLPVQRRFVTLFRSAP